jgi:hypothetical protein
MSLCAPINAIASGGKSSPNVAAKVGGMCLRGNSLPKVDSFSYLGERRYLAHPFSTSTDLQCIYLSGPCCSGCKFNIVWTPKGRPV